MSNRQCFSLTSGFSRVWAAQRPASRFNGMPAQGKTVETVLAGFAELSPG
jgi:hypothetical protein